LRQFERYRRVRAEAGSLAECMVSRLRGSPDLLLIIKVDGLHRAAICADLRAPDA
jgi:hypothetical protein